MKNCGHVLLMDTAGCFRLAIRLPTKDYRPRPRPRPREKDRKQYLRGI